MTNIRWYMYLTRLYIRDLMSFFIYIFLVIKKHFFKNKDKDVRILVYHSISETDKRKDTIRITVTPELFRRQVEYLILKKYRIVSLDTIVEHISGDSAVKDNIIALTFDDGFGDNFKNSFNILKSNGLTATYFLAYDYIDSNKTFSWYQNDSPCAKPLTWENIFEMTSGGMDIGSHTLSHINLSSINDNDDKLNKEIFFSKKIIEDKIKIQVKYFAYPIGCQGTYNNKTEDMARKAGYKAAFINVFGGNKKGDNVFELKRTRIDWNDTLFKFKMKIEGAYDWVDSKPCLKIKI